MGLFKNEVGRPSNETLRKRKVAYFAIALGAVALVGGGGYFAYKSFNKVNVGSTNKNIATTTKEFDRYPLTMITKNGKSVDCLLGYENEEDVVALLTKYNIIK